MTTRCASEPIPLHPPARSRRHRLTIRHFLAASWVRVFHLQSRAPSPLGPGRTPLSANGALAMTRLFHLSGAVLRLGYRDLRREAADLAAFYWSRVARIMPVF